MQPMKREKKTGSSQLPLENKKNRTAFIYDVADQMAFIHSFLV